MFSLHAKVISKAFHWHDILSISILVNGLWCERNSNRERLDTEREWGRKWRGGKKVERGGREKREIERKERWKGKERERGGEEREGRR